MSISILIVLFLRFLLFLFGKFISIMVCITCTSIHNKWVLIPNTNKVTSILFLNIVNSHNVTPSTFHSPVNVFVSLSNRNYFSTKIFIHKS